MAYTAQKVIINKVNRQFKKDKRPSEFKFNEGGVCNGLSTVYAFYALQGQEDKFKYILESIASGHFENENVSHDELYQFAHRVLIAQTPQQYAQHLDQWSSLETLQIDNKPLQSAFAFSLATSQRNWAEIIKDKIKLENKEVMLVSSANHAAAVRKGKDSKGKDIYIVYDPNYANGFKEFRDEAALVYELHHNVFGYLMFGNLGLSVSVVRNPRDESRSESFPTAGALYQTYLNPKNLTATIIVEFPKLTTFNTLKESIATIHDKNAIEYLLKYIKLPEKKVYEMAIAAVSYNNVAALSLLIPKIENNDNADKTKMKGLFLQALKNGRLEVFNALEEKFQVSFKDWNTSLLIKYAALGGNPKLLEKLIHNVETHYRDTPQHFFVGKSLEKLKHLKDLNQQNLQSRDEYKRLSKQQQKASTERFNQRFDVEIKSTIMTPQLRQAIPEAIKSGSPGCVDILLKKLKEYNAQLSDKEKIDYLLLAITHNKVEVVKHLIDNNHKISKKLLATISLSTLAVHRTELDVLIELEQGGVQFSAEAQNIISQKRDNQWLTLHTVLNLLLNYLSNFLGQNQMAYEDNLRKYKKYNCQQILQTLNTQSDHLPEKEKKELEQLIAQYKEKLNLASDLIELDKILEELKSKQEELKSKQEEQIPVISLDTLIDGELYGESDDEEVHAEDEKQVETAKVHSELSELLALPESGKLEGTPVFIAHSRQSLFANTGKPSSPTKESGLNLNCTQTMQNLYRLRNNSIFF